jgi:hypothetical protein
MIQTSTAMGLTARRQGSPELTISLQRHALRALASRPRELGDYLYFGADDRKLRRRMEKVLRELRLDDMGLLVVESDLTPALRQKHWLRKVSVVQVGPGVRAATAELLRSVEPLILDQAVIVFQHWNGQQEAFEAFLRARPGLTAKRLPSESTVGSFLVTRALTV